MAKEKKFQPKKFVVANWKMNPLDADSAAELFTAVTERASAAKNTLTIIASPIIFLGVLNKLSISNRIAFGAQNCFWNEDTR